MYKKIRLSAESNTPVVVQRKNFLFTKGAIAGVVSNPVHLSTVNGLHQSHITGDWLNPTVY